jgi:phosphoenolpyruvate---glycerone phosphotransferase subunit DhaL
MNDRVTTSELKQMLLHAAQCLRSQAEELSRLDSVAGDGDHGTTMLRVAEQFEAAVNDPLSQNPAALLRTCGWKVLNVDGGASSALFGTFFKGMGDGAGEGDPDCAALAEILASGLNSILKQTRARTGDKTMIDALEPAVEAVGKTAAAGDEIPAALESAAAAALEGADRTKALVARYGRAKFLGEKTLGHADAGATSVALIFQGFSQALMARRETNHGRR